MPKRMTAKFAPMVVVASLLASCTQALGPAPITDIPSTALPVKEGSGRLFFQAVDPGTVYVFDADTVSLLFSAAVDRSQRFVLDPAHNRATVEGKPVYEKPLPKRHSFRLYFEPRVGIPSTQESQ